MFAGRVKNCKLLVLQGKCKIEIFLSPVSTVSYKLIRSFGQVKFSMDKYILTFYLSLDK